MFQISCRKVSVGVLEEEPQPHRLLISIENGFSNPLFDIEKTPGKNSFIPKAKKILDEYEEALLSKQAIFEIWNHIVEHSAESITIRQESNSDSLG